MTNRRFSKTKIIIILVIIAFVAGLVVYRYSRVIFQEGNPWPAIKAISQLTFSGTKMVKLSGADNVYLTKSREGALVMADFMKEKGYEYVDQMGSAYLYQSATQNTILTRRQYSRFYLIWTITGNNMKTDNYLWSTITNEDGLTYQYPEDLLVEYFSIVDWPPLVKKEAGTFTCLVTPPEMSSVHEITTQRAVDDRLYCVNIKHDGAAGSVYSSYIYTTIKNDELIKISFSLRYPRCDNYDEEKKEACVREREAFDLDALIDRIVQTVKIIRKCEVI